MKVVNLDDIKHGIRVANYSVDIAREIKLSKHKVEDLYIAGLFHDIGKAHIDQSILNKPGMLTKKEKDQIFKHPIYSYEEILNIGYPKEIALYILHHHENFDGTGYPHGLKGFAIPIGARILKISDVFDALTMDRPYRNKLTVKEALQIMDGEKATYDPELYLAFTSYLYSKFKDQMITPSFPGDIQVFQVYNRMSL
jgi:putative nucleotidyltransferase with HDIG domain